MKLAGADVDLISPAHLRSYRRLLNTTAMDLMYYMSPAYGREIYTAVVERMNELHACFMAHNADFTGRVSIVGHSLGAVIAYDIVNQSSSTVPRLNFE